MPGNTTGDALGRTFTYDAENKQVEVRDQGSVVRGQYWYDGDGKRVKKIAYDANSNETETTIFVYDAGGKSIAEYSDVVANSTDAKVAYLTADHLGSPRINTDQDGAIIARHDYMPFGEEIDGTGGRTTGLNYGNDSVRKQFIGYEKDNEVDLHFAQARMYAYKHGRFMTTDPSRRSIQKVYSQSWNRYTYCYNNPLVLVDDNGKWPTGTHNKIIQTAFNNPNFSTKAIERGSYKTDVPGTVLESNAYKHAMTPGSKVREMGLEGAKAWAKNEAAAFINGNLADAKNILRPKPGDYGSLSERTDRSLEKFGEAMHTVMDNVSPAHRGFQVFYSYDNAAGRGAFWGAVIGGAPGAVVGAAESVRRDVDEHSEKEEREPTQSEMDLMVDRMRMLYRDTYGQAAYELAVTEDERKKTSDRISQRSTDGRAL